MSFTLPEYHAPDFSLNQFRQSADVSLQRASRDGVAPLGFHSTSMFPEYFKVGGTWLLAEESRMDCLVVLDDSGRVQIGRASCRERV